jgi:hypothetical protein
MAMSLAGFGTKNNCWRGPAAIYLTQHVRLVMSPVGLRTKNDCWQGPAAIYQTVEPERGSQLGVQGLKAPRVIRQ